MTITEISKPRSFSKLVGANLHVNREVRALAYHLVECISNLKNAKIQDIISYLSQQGIEINEINLTLFLNACISSGLLKRMTSNNLVVYSLNIKKKKPITHNRKVGFNRPNYGIGKSIVNLLNQNGKIFHAPEILKKLEDAYPDATVRTVEAALKTICRKNPAQLSYSNGTYLRKATVTYLTAK